MTYSIVARDPATGELGVAVQTDYFGVGSICPWAEAGVGAVATQSFAEESYGPLGLDRMRDGEGAPDVLAALVAADDGEALRQVAMVDAEGRVAAHTGSRCVPACGDARGEQVSAQANMMERDTVWGAMLEGYANEPGALPLRLLAALRAAEGEGGDIRGRQSAAMIVVAGERQEHPWQGRLVDLRVESHPDPVRELERLYRLHRAYRHLDRAHDLASAGDPSAAVEEYDRAAALAPEDPQVWFWRGLGLAGAGRFEDARESLERARAVNPRYAQYLRRLPVALPIPDDPALLDALLPPEAG